MSSCATFRDVNVDPGLQMGAPKYSSSAFSPVISPSMDERVPDP